MFPKNLIAFTLPKLAIGVDEINAKLREFALKPIGPAQMVSSGFVSPFGRGSDQFAHQVNNMIWLTVGVESRSIPPSALEQKVSEKISEIEEKSGSRLGSRARKKVKEDVLLEMLPHAFVTSTRTNAFIDTEQGLFFVDSSSRKAAEGVVSEVRGALGSFPALPVNPAVSPGNILTGWIAGEPMPEALVMGEEAELADPIEKGPVAKLQRHDLRCDEVTTHLSAGKRVTRLALSFDGKLDFVVGDDLVLRKIKFLDAALEPLESQEHENANAELDARFTILAGELRQVWPVLAERFEISRAAQVSF